MFGGFTWSGGEPLLQDRFAVRFFTAAKSEINYMVVRCACRLLPLRLACRNCQY